MSEDNKITRRELFKWVLGGTATGALVGVATYEPPPPPDKTKPQRPDIADKLPPVLNPKTQVGHITSRAVAGGALGAAACLLIKGKSPPADTGRRRREIAQDFQAGREHELWQDQADRGRNPNDTQRNPDR